MHSIHKQREPIPRFPQENDPLVARWYRQVERISLPVQPKGTRAGRSLREIRHFRIAVMIILLLIGLALFFL